MRHQISVPIEGDLFLDPHGDQTLTGDSQTDWGSVDPVVQGLFEKHFS